MTRLPSESTLLRTLRQIVVVILEAAVARLTQPLTDAESAPSQVITPCETILQAQAVDGKALRGATSCGAPTHLVSLVQHGSAVTLAQADVAQKPSESSAVPVLLGRRELTDTIITMDALLTQRAIGQLDCRMEFQGGESVRAKLAEIDTVWAERRQELADKPGELRRAEEAWRHTRQKFEGISSNQNQAPVELAPPGTSDNLAQRNLLIIETDNPGLEATHTVQHSFDFVLPGRRERVRIDENVCRGQIRERQTRRLQTDTAGAVIHAAALTHIPGFHTGPCGGGHTCYYRRTFKGKVKNWVGRYAPGDEKRDPENVGDWQLWYRIEAL
ncbi:MAG TPA: hypothetical protein VFU22_31955 [Roseiflexaceae bacterium]|nr:hypothetical protein [Roseiflexaceae bacterium]